MGSSFPEYATVKLGSNITQDLYLGDSIDHIEIRLDNPEAGSVSTARLTEDGTVTIVPSKPGKLLVYFEFIQKDGSRVLTGSTYDIIE